MNKQKSSTTAEVVAFGRAYHATYDEPKIFDDFLARQMLTDENYAHIEGRLPTYIGFIEPFKQWRYKKEEGGALRRIIHRLVCPAPLARNKYTEDLLNNAKLFDIEQYVILGAGYDTFAFRNIDKLDKITVFEVDHPATQKIKLERINDLGWEIHPHHQFVPVDFDDDLLEKSLLAAGFDPTKKTLFSWLGVTYYLTRETIHNTLKAIKKVSAKGSLIVFDYPDKKFYNPLKTTLRVTIMVRLVKSVNEPMKTGYTYDEIIHELDMVGFDEMEHLTRSDIQELYFNNRTDDYSAFENINIMCAVSK